MHLYPFRPYTRFGVKLSRNSPNVASDQSLHHWLTEISMGYGVKMKTPTTDT